jgi:hypothetical protein
VCFTPRRRPCRAFALACRIPSACFRAVERRPAAASSIRRNPITAADAQPVGKRLAVGVSGDSRQRSLGASRWPAFPCLPPAIDRGAERVGPRPALGSVRSSERRSQRSLPCDLEALATSARGGELGEQDGCGTHRNDERPARSLKPGASRAGGAPVTALGGGVLTTRSWRDRRTPTRRTFLCADPWCAGRAVPPRLRGSSRRPSKVSMHARSPAPHRHLIGQRCPGPG